MHTRREIVLTVVAAAAAPLAACGGGGSDAPPVEGPVPEPPGASDVPVDGPAWPGFARNAQHQGLGVGPSQKLEVTRWSAPVDLAPAYTSGNALLAHYGSPLVTRRNTVVLPVRVDADDRFRVEARRGGSGSLLWSLGTAWRAPPHEWLPPLQATIALESRLMVPTSGGRVIVRENVDDVEGATMTRTFFGDAAYAAAPTTYDATVFVATPLVADAAGHAVFGFTVIGANPAGLVGGFARLGADGSSTWVSAAQVSGDAAMARPATSVAPVFSLDERTVYAVVTRADGADSRLVAFDAVTLAPRASVRLLDPLSGTSAWVNPSSSASPVVGPDGDVYFGVLEANAPAHNYRGWLLHFDATLGQVRTPGSFGWDHTPSIVPRSMVPQYGGDSPYLLVMKDNSYAGIGSGDGLHRVTIVDPRGTQADRFVPAVTVMREVISVLGPTPDPDVPGGVEEWCINTAAVDPPTSSVLMNNEDGVLYRWHLPSNTLVESIRTNNGYAQAYTPTIIGPDGRVYAVNNARLFSIGAAARV